MAFSKHNLFFTQGTKRFVIILHIPNFLQVLKQYEGIPLNQVINWIAHLDYLKTHNLRQLKVSDFTLKQ